MKMLRAIFCVTALMAGLHADGQYTFGTEVQTTPSASITYNSATGVFQYTDDANSTTDDATLPLTGTAASIVTTSAGWTATLTPNLPAKTIGVGKVVMHLILSSTNTPTNTVLISLAQHNYTGKTGSQSVPNDFYGTMTQFIAANNNGNVATTALGNSLTYNGVSYLTLSGGTATTATTESLAAVTGVISLSYNASTNTVTGSYNGTAIGSFSLASWGSNPPLTLSVQGESKAVTVTAGADTASTFYVSATVPSYNYVDLGVPASLVGNTTAYSYGTGINDAGIIVGTAGSSTTAPTAILDANGTMTDLGAQLAGGSFAYSYGYGINQAGDIVGSFYESTPGTTQAFLYADGVFTSLGALSPNAQSNAIAVNNGDQVVGNSLDASGLEHAFVYSGGTMHDLGFLDTGAGAFSSGLGINDSGEAVGDSEVDTPAFGGYIPHGFYTTSYTTNTGLVDMGFESVPIGGGGFEEYKEIAYAVDNSGSIVGGACPVCPGQAFIDTNGVFTYLGALSGDDSSYATAKNDSGEIVGASFVESGSEALSNQTYIPGPTKFATDRRGFLYKNGTMYDLNAITANITSGWTIVEAAAINHSGQIVGYAIQGAVEQTTSIAHAILLQPVTPQATITLSNLTATFDGTAKSPTVTTVPTALEYTLTYLDGSGHLSTRAPVAAGSYTVTARVNDPNYSGSTTGTLDISAGTQTITFPPIAKQQYSNAPFTLNSPLNATASSGLPVSYTYVSGPATLSGANNDTVTVTGIGTVVIQASQAGNGTYTAATSVNQSFAVAAPQQFPSVAPGGVGGEPLGDSVPNLLKYVYDISLADTMTAADRAALPAVGSMTTTTNGTTTTYLTLTYRQNALATGVTVAPQTSTDLKNWSTPSSLTTSQIGVDANTNDPIMQAQVPFNGTTEFIRLLATP